MAEKTLLSPRRGPGQEERPPTTARVTLMRSLWRRRLGVFAFFTSLLTVFWGLARVGYQSPKGFRFSHPTAVSGDETHYSVAISALVFDHRFDPRRAYNRALRGGGDAGDFWRGAPLGHHTYVVDPSTGEHRYWSLVYDDRKPRPCEGADCVPFERIDPHFGPNSIEVSNHPPAFPLLMALLIWPFRTTSEALRNNIAAAIVFVSCLTATLTFLLARQIGFSVAQSLAATALLVLASSWLPYLKSAFSEPVIALAVVGGAWSLRRGSPALAAAAGGVAMALKLPFAMLGIGWALERALARRWRDVVAIAGVTGAFGVALIAMNYWLARTVVIAGGGWAWTDGIMRSVQTLIEPAHGLFWFVPWTILSFWELGRSALRHDGDPVWRQIAIPVALYAGLLAANGYSGASCYGPRYWVPFFPLFAVAAVSFANRARWVVRCAFVILVLAATATAIGSLFRYPYLWDLPPNAAWKIW